MADTLQDNKKKKRWMCFLMGVAVCVWGLGYVYTKIALGYLDPLSLVFYKYATALVLMVAIWLFPPASKWRRLKQLWSRRGDRLEQGTIFKGKDIWLFVLSAFFGVVLYFYAEYSALAYMPISLVSIVLAFAPVVSIAIEAALYKRKTNRKVMLGIAVCIGGVALIIGFDWELLLQGRIFGYLLAFSCVFCWNIFNFMTASLHERYATVTLSMNQLICTCLMLLPYVIINAPPMTTFPPVLIGCILYIGWGSSGFGYLTMVRALHVLGPTTTALFSNFLPVTATIFSWLILHETIGLPQCVGGIIVITAGYVVIKEKGKDTSPNEKIAAAEQKDKEAEETQQ